MGREMWIYKVTVQNSIALFRDYRNRLHVFILIILFEHLFKSSTWKNETLKLLTFDCRDSYQNLQIIRTKSLWELIFNIIKQFELRITCNLWKVSKYGVISGPYLDTFHAVMLWFGLKWISLKLWYLNETVVIAIGPWTLTSPVPIPGEEKKLT